MFQKVVGSGRSGLCPGQCGAEPGSDKQGQGRPEGERGPTQEGKKLLRP